MTRPLTKISLAVLASLAGMVAHGMNLQEAFEKALTQDATIRVSEATLESERERLPQAQAQLLPVVQASVARNRNNLDTTTPNFLGTPVTSNSRYLSFGKTVSLRQPLFNSRLYFQLDQAKDQVNDAQATHQRNLQDLSVRVGSAYMDVLLTTEQLQLVQAQKKQYSAMVDAAQKAIAAGSGTRTEVEESQARLDMAIASELEILQQVEYTRRQLEILINEPVQQLAELNPLGLSQLSGNIADLQTWLTKAEQESPEIQSLIAKREAADKEVAKMMSDHAPTLDGVLQWSDSGNENPTRLDTRFINSAVGFQLVVPIYQGGYVNSRIRQAIADQTRVRETLEATRRDLNLRIHKEHRGVTEGRLKVRALEQAVHSAQQLRMSTIKSVQAGIRTSLDVLNAEQQLAIASRDLIQARYLMLISRLRLNALAGTDPREAIAEIARAFLP